MLYKGERKEAELIKPGSLHAILSSLSFCLSSEYLGPVGAVSIFIGSLLEAKADFMLPWESINIGAKRYCWRMHLRSHLGGSIAVRQETSWQQ